MDNNVPPKYVRKRISDNGRVTYRYNPPQKYVNAGIVQRKELGSDWDKAVTRATKLNAKIESYLATCSPSDPLAPLSHLILEYKSTNHFKSLRPVTQKMYADYMTAIGEYAGRTPFRDVNVSTAKRWYDDWLSHGIYVANYRVTMAVILYNYAYDMDYLSANPFSRVKRKTPKQRRVRWTPQEVHKLLETAYSEFKWRSVGLIVHMAYEFAQRVIDMRTLEWSSVDLEKQVITLTQTKRNAEIHVPISDELTAILKQQKKDFGFQQYVCPKPRIVRNKYVTYTNSSVTKVFALIREAAGLREELQMKDLRRTGLTEMNEALVPVTGMMAVGGHTNSVSLKPYLVHTLTAARAAQEQRFAKVREEMKE